MRRSLISFGIVLWACRPVAPAAASCPADLLLAGQDDIARFAGCTDARSVTIRTAAPLDTTPLALVSISGDLVIGPSVGIEVIELRGLRRLGRLHASSNQSLRRLALPQLATVARIEITGNAALVTIAMPHLARAEAIAITDAPELELIDLPALAAIDELTIADHPKLAALELGGLARAGAVRIENVPTLPAEIVDALRQLPAR